MEPAADLDAFVAAPVGRYLVRPSCLVWCAAPDLQGVMIWGALDEGAFRELLAIGRRRTSGPLAERRSVLIDGHAITRVDGEALLGFIAAARGHVATWSRGVERHAVVLPAGLGGILVAGVLPALGVTHPIQFTRDVESALDHLAHPELRRAHDEATAIAGAARGSTALLFRLRAHLGGALAGASVEGAAAHLGMSTRTLQRELAALGTSFSDELRRARVAAAEALLRHSDLKIEAIATRVGLGTASRMSAQLRRELRVTASELRARARGSAAPASNSWIERPAPSKN